METHIFFRSENTLIFFRSSTEIQVLDGFVQNQFEPVMKPNRDSDVNPDSELFGITDLNIVMSVRNIGHSLISFPGILLSV